MKDGITRVRKVIELVTGVSLDDVANDDFELLLTFNNGEKRIFDAHQIMYMEAFTPLKNIEFFKLVKVKFGTVVWPRDIDYCPDMLYEQSKPV